jgi:multidrug efflux pump subunit AcrB
MKPEEMAKLSVEELTKKLKSNQFALFALAGVVTVLVAACAYLTYWEGFSVFTFLPVPFLGIIVTLWASLKPLRKEIARRKQG